MLLRQQLVSLLITVSLKGDPSYSRLEPRPPPAPEGLLPGGCTKSALPQATTAGL